MFAATSSYLEREGQSEARGGGFVVGSFVRGCCFFSWDWIFILKRRQQPVTLATLLTMGGGLVAQQECGVIGMRVLHQRGSGWLGVGFRVRVRGLNPKPYP